MAAERRDYGYPPVHYAPRNPSRSREEWMRFTQDTKNAETGKFPHVILRTSEWQTFAPVLSEPQAKALARDAKKPTRQKIFPKLRARTQAAPDQPDLDQ